MEEKQKVKKLSKKRKHDPGEEGDVPKVRILNVKLNDVSF